MTMEHLFTHTITPNDNKIVLELYDNVGEMMGIMYYERAKKSFTNKPISMNKWGMVDCKIERLYEKYPEVEPIDVLRWGDKLITTYITQLLMTNL